MFFQASIQGRHSVVPKTEIDLQLGDMNAEIDLTIIDRLHGVLYPSSTTAHQPKPLSQYFTSAPHTDAVSTVRHRVYKLSFTNGFTMHTTS